MPIKLFFFQSSEVEFVFVKEKKAIVKYFCIFFLSHLSPLIIIFFIHLTLVSIPVASRASASEKGLNGIQVVVCRLL